MATAWLPVPGFPGYAVSSGGEVWSYNRNALRKIVPPKGGRYCAVTLSRDGVAHQRQLHRLVSEAFLGPKPEGLVTRHLDGNKENNSVSNLVYGTHRENVLDTVNHGRHRNAIKNSCSNNHEFSTENTRYRYHPDGSFKQRVCKVCDNTKAGKR